MRKTYQMILALLLCAVGAMNVSAAEVSLQEIPFCSWDGWGADAQSTGTADCAWVLGESTGQPYGDSQVINYADLSNYSKLYVTVTEGTPRFLFNRDVEEGQWNANEAESHLIDNTKNGWSAKYFSSEAGENEGETVYVVDLKLMVKEKGFAHLHAIKGANWANVTVLNMTVFSQGKVQQVGWTNIVNNSDMESDDLSSYFVALDAANNDGYQPAEIQDGIGVDGSRGIMVTSLDNPSEVWATQFFVRLNEALVEGTKWRVSFDYKADNVAPWGSGCHREPRDYIAGALFATTPDFATNWQTYTAEGEIDADHNGLRSIAFDLNNSPTANNYYFDNFKFEVYKYGTTAEFSNDVIEVFFGFDTNIPELVEETGAMRVFFDKSCATVKVNGVEKEIYSIEGLKDGRFYIFMEEAIEDRATVEVSVNNTIGLVYTSGINNGSPVDNFYGIASLNPDIEDNGGYPYIMETPTLMKSDPEDGSFNLDAGTQITLYFDKEVDCAALEVTANGSALSKSPADGFAKEVTVSGSLPMGECVITVDKVYPEMRLDDTIFGTYEFTLNIGQSSFDPNQKPEEIIPQRYFEECAANSVPEGYKLYADGETPEERLPGGNYGSGARMFDFSAGGDFTKGLYFRTWYLEYGTTEGHEVYLNGGTKYRTSFNSCQWNSGGHWMQFAIYDANNLDTPVFTQMVENGPNVNESRNAVNGSTVSNIDFTPENDGKYVLRWILCTGADGTPTNNAWQNGVILANVKMMSMPNTAGYEYFLLLSTALENAQKALADNGGERYQGEAYYALQSAIDQYQSEMSGYHGPSQFTNAAAALDKAATALKDHRQLCDEYDAQIKKAIDVVRQNEMPEGDPSKATKFVSLDLFQQLKSIVNKYNGTSEWQNVGDEENPQWTLNYSFNVITDDTELKAAIAELKDIANITSLLFTQGESKSTDTGVKVLLERLRRGAETMAVLGFPEDYPLLQTYKIVLEDNDGLAEAMKKAIKLEIYKRLGDPVPTLFQPVVDEQTMEETTPSYDMTVFFKNPNIYKQLPTLNDLSQENVPGWVTAGNIGLWCGWNGAVKNIEGIAEDCAFSIYHNEGSAEQTIEDLPAGVYNVTIDAARWDNVEPSGSTFVYIKTQGSSEYAETQDIAYYGQYVMNHDNVFENVEITDGKLTVGANFASDNGQYFFDKVTLRLVGPASNFDYAGAYVQGIEKTEASRVNSVEFYDLNGRRITGARQGVVIVKKHMANGTLQTEKVVRK